MPYIPYSHGWADNLQISLVLLSVVSGHKQLYVKLLCFLELEIFTVAAADLSLTQTFYNFQYILTPTFSVAPFSFRT